MFPSKSLFLHIPASIDLLFRNTFVTPSTYCLIYLPKKSRPRVAQDVLIQLVKLPTTTNNSLLHDLHYIYNHARLQPEILRLYIKLQLKSTQVKVVRFGTLNRYFFHSLTWQWKSSRYSLSTTFVFTCSSSKMNPPFSILFPYCWLVPNANVVRGDVFDEVALP